MMSRLVRLGSMSAIAVGLAIAAPVAVAAHHSFAAFDLTAQKSVTGTVKEFDWTNPHTWIWVNVPSTQGVVEVWGFEG